jgi:hypothetical protein
MWFSTFFCVSSFICPVYRCLIKTASLTLDENINLDKYHSAYHKNYHQTLVLPLTSGFKTPLHPYRTPTETALFICLSVCMEQLENTE